MSASKYNSLNRTSIKELTGDYISANSRQGGSYYSNYHRQLPKVLIGSTRSGAQGIYVSCESVEKGSYITVSGFIENEYLLNELNLYYRIDQSDEFVLIEREPYAEWSFNLSSTSLYTSNSNQIELKLDGLDAQGKNKTYIEIYNIIIEENCITDIDCKGSITETIVDLKDISLDDVYMVVINDEVFYAESLPDLKNILLRKNIELEVYTKTRY